MRDIFLTLFVVASIALCGGTAIASSDTIAERQAILHRLPDNIKIKKEIRFPNQSVVSQVRWDVLYMEKGPAERLTITTGNITTVITTIGLHKQTFAILETSNDRSCMPKIVGGEFDDEQKPVLDNQYAAEDLCQPPLENLEHNLTILTRVSLKELGILDNADLTKLIRK